MSTDKADGQQAVGQEVPEDLMTVREAAALVGVSIARASRSGDGTVISSPGPARGRASASASLPCVPWSHRPLAATEKSRPQHGTPCTRQHTLRAWSPMTCAGGLMTGA